ncbi:hypothetical protein OG455_32520 [Kitasatospora sp. NBC_01287]|uniref:hypothetical protein n=1 Tax=Kitasatospora sp. NBC_01287 TaxID=2903573 RepID=UPI002257310A|nr:hypothetical protein [Kitasatospora sp. NBC_01287]MCX4750184.1 hypothetical protein [Kitasatospora sp. NBC_01287]
MRIPALLATALLLPLPLAQAASATTTPTTTTAPTPGASHLAPAVSYPIRRPHGTNHGPAVRSGAAHRAAFAKDLSVSVSPPSFPTAPGGVGTILVTVCNNGTDTPTAATLVVNGPADPGLTLTAGPYQSGPVDGGWNWIRFPVARNLAPASCETDKIFGSTLSTTPGPASYGGGTAVVTWDPSQNPDDNATTWSFDTSAPVDNAVLELVRPPKPAGPGNPADFEVLERNLGPSSGYPVPGKVVAMLPAGSRFLSSAPDYQQCAISADGTTATCDDDVLNTWSTFNRGFALQIDPNATPGTSIPVTVTQQAPGNPAPHSFTLTVLIPVC